jgi:flagellar basal-body rod protein FlgG
MIAAQRYQDILSNNLSNAQTPGYKQDQTVLHAFNEMLLYRIRAFQHGQWKQAGGAGSGGSQRTPIGFLHTGVFAHEAIPSFTQGPLVETGRTLDLAIVDETLPQNPDTGQKGTLFLAVRTDDGEIRYLRNGQFSLDPEGFLTTADGYYVLDEALNPIYVGNEQFSVTMDGYIHLDEAALADAPPGTPAQPRLWLGYTEHAHQLVREGNGLWRWAPDEAVDAPYGEPELVYGLPLFNDPDNPAGLPYQLRQGFIEQSNVDLSQTMTQMLMQYRLYEANQKVLQAYDRSMDLAANQIARLF